MNLDTLPRLMQLNDGTPVTSPAQWETRRSQLLHILGREEFGFAPPPPARVDGTITGWDTDCCSGHAVLEDIRISFPTPKGSFSFPVKFFVPQTTEKCPLFLLLNFRPDAYDKYFPAEEIIDNGFALAVIYYEDITADNEDWQSGLAGQYPRSEDGTGWGKISMWAWGASRALDYLVTRPEIDTRRIGVIGHSRLGKTALWCAAQDQRVSLACSNESGCAGAALERMKHPGAETLKDIVTTFPFWFCANYQKYAGKPELMPFDQHFLLGAIAPRAVAVGSASGDLWADPYSEQLCCAAASDAWKIFEKTGYAGPREPIKPGEASQEGEVFYHLRDGIHFLGRTDWLRYLEAANKIHSQL